MTDTEYETDLWNAACLGLLRDSTLAGDIAINFAIQADGYMYNGGMIDFIDCMGHQSKDVAASMRWLGLGALADIFDSLCEVFPESQTADDDERDRLTTRIPDAQYALIEELETAYYAGSECLYDAFRTALRERPTDFTRLSIEQQATLIAMYARGNDVFHKFESRQRES